VVGDGNNTSFWHPFETATDSEGNVSILWGFEDTANGVTRSYDELNIFSFYALSRAMKGYGSKIGTFPAAGIDPDGYTWEMRFQKLLTDNQQPGGGYSDQSWVTGSGFGTGWALMTMSEKAPLAFVHSIGMSAVSATKTSHVYATVKIDNSKTRRCGRGCQGHDDEPAGAIKSFNGTTGTTGEVTFDYIVKGTLPRGAYQFCVTDVAAKGMGWGDVPRSAAFSTSSCPNRRYGRGWQRPRPFFVLAYAAMKRSGAALRSSPGLPAASAALSHCAWRPPAPGSPSATAAARPRPRRW